MKKIILMLRVIIAQNQHQISLLRKLIALREDKNYDAEELRETEKLMNITMNQFNNLQ